MKTLVTPLAELARLVEGSVRGDPNTPICGAAPLAEVAEGQITLVDHADRLKAMQGSPAAAVVLPAEVDFAALPAIAVADVHAAFSKIVTHFRPSPTRRDIGISIGAHVSPTARCAAGVDIHPGATIGDEVGIGPGSVVLPGAHVLAGCRIGRDVTIGSGAVLYENTIVGDRVHIHGGAVIGSHGFGFHQEQGRHVPAAQLGYVVIEDDVEIGANATIDRGTYGATRIGEGTKIDNLVQIAHNCRIGKHNLICSQVGIAGSTTTGDYVVMAGQVGVRDHVHIGQGAVISAMAGISNDVPAGATMMGIPATPVREQRHKQAALAKLPEMRKAFKALRRELADLKEQLQLGPEATAQNTESNSAQGDTRPQDTDRAA